MQKYIYSKSHINEFKTVLLRTAEDKTVKRLFYAAVRSLMLGRWGTKHVAVDMLKTFCDSDELCAFIALYCGKNQSRYRPGLAQRVPGS